MPMHKLPPMFPKPIRKVMEIVMWKKMSQPTDDGTHFHDFEDFMPPGTIAPDFKLNTLIGEEISLSDYRGNFLVLEVGAYT